MTDQEKIVLGRKMWHELIASDVFGVRRCLDDGCDPSIELAPEYGNSTPLIWAARRADAEICRLLLNRGARVDQVDTSGDSALHVAISSRHQMATNLRRAHAVEIILEHGANPNGVGSDLTPLHAAIDVRDGTNSRQDSMSIIRMLVRCGADPSWAVTGSSNSYITPFQLACKIGDAEQLKLFLGECGQDPLQKTSSGRSLMQLCQHRSNEIKELLRSAMLSKKTELAIASGLTDENGASTSVRSIRKSSGMSPL